MEENEKPVELIVKYKKYFDELLANSKAPAKIDETNVYEKANPVPRKILFDMLR